MSLTKKEDERIRVLEELVGVLADDVKTLQHDYTVLRKKDTQTKMNLLCRVD